MTKPQRNKAATVSAIIFRKGDAVLLTRRFNTGYQDGFYEVPAGHIDAGELPSDAAIREAKEEVGVTIRKENLAFAHAAFRAKHDDTGDRVDYYFEVRKWEGDVINAEPKKCDDLLWARPGEFPKNVSAHVRLALECIERKECFSEISLQFQIDNGSQVDPSML